MLGQMEDKLGENHSGELKHLSAEAKAERIIAEELHPLRSNEADLTLRLKDDPAKLAIASRLRTETILPVTWIAARLHLGSAKSARPRVRNWRRRQNAQGSSAPKQENRSESEQMNVALL
jgi:hypothetical protein